MKNRHPAVASAYEDLIVFPELNGQFQVAIELCKEVLDIRKSSIGRESLLVSKVHLRMANIYFNMGDSTNSLKNLDEALSILRTLQANSGNV